MERERLVEILRDEEIDIIFPDGCNVFSGLGIITKYLPKKGVEGAEHDIIYSVDINELAEAGITEEDAKQLRIWNWMYYEDCDCLACFV